MPTHKPLVTGFQKELSQIVWYAIPVVLLGYTGLRAYTLSLTHDECDSFSLWKDYDIVQCFFEARCWETANLHWLYVLLMQLSVKLFGPSALAIRLPSLLAHALYLFFSFQLIKQVMKRQWNNHPWLAMLGYVLLNFNPYLLEFFGLARGYGLSIAWMMGGLYFVACWLEKNEKTALIAWHLCTVLAVLSNFTLLNFYACLMVLSFGMLLLADLRRRSIRWKVWAETGTAALFFSACLFVLIRLPISVLKHNGEFKWGSASFYDTLYSLMSMLLYDWPFSGGYIMKGAALLLLMLFTAAMGFAVKEIWKEEDSPGLQFFCLALLLPVCISLASIVQHHFLGSNYLDGRKLLFYIPLVSLVIFLLLLKVFEKGVTAWKRGLALGLGLLCFSQLLFSVQWSHAQEWQYDSKTKEMLAYLRSRIPPDKTIRLGVKWMFHPSCSYYIKTTPYVFVSEELHYSNELRTDNYYDYYYVACEDVTKLHSSYILDKSFTGAGCLMRRK